MEKEQHTMKQKLADQETEQQTMKQKMKALTTENSELKEQMATQIKEQMAIQAAELTKQFKAEMEMYKNQFDKMRNDIQMDKANQESKERHQRLGELHPGTAKTVTHQHNRTPEQNVKRSKTSRETANPQALFVEPTTQSDDSQHNDAAMNGSNV